MKKIKTAIRAVLSLGILLCLIFGAAGCTTTLDRKKAVREIEAYAALLLERNEYAEENESKIESIKGEGKEAVKPCKDKAELEATVNEAKYRMDAVEPIESFNAETTGKLYSIKQAYENGFIIKAELKRIAYYFDSDNIDGRPRYPRKLNQELEYKIKESVAKNLNYAYEQGDISESPTAEGIDIVSFCGKYADCYMVITRNHYFINPADIRYEEQEIGGVRFRVSAYTDEYVWKMN